MDTQSLGVKVDDEVYDLTISSFDTIQTLIILLSKKINLPPIFIFLTKKDSLQKVENIKDQPFRSIKRISETNDLANAKLEFVTLRSLSKIDNFNTAYEIAKKYLPDPDAVFATFYYFYNKPENAEFLNNPSSNKFREKYSESFDLLKEIDENKFNGVISVSSFINSYEKFVRRVEESNSSVLKASTLYDVTKNSEKYKSESKKNEKLITDTKLTFTNIKCVLNRTDQRDEFEYFNDAVLSTDVPLIFINGFYKILKGFSISKQWIDRIKEYSDVSIRSENEKHKNHLVMFVLNKYNYTQTKKENADMFSLISVYIQDNEIHLNINSKIEDYNKNTDLKEDQFLKRICNSLNIKTKDLDVKIYPQNLRCHFYITKTLIEKLFYYELIMNNKIVSDFLCANERFRIFNKRGGIQTVFKQCDIVFSLQSLFVSRPLRKKIGSSVKVNDYVVEIKVSFAKNLFEVDLLKKYLSVMVAIYNNKKDCIQKLYSNLPSFDQERKDVLLEGKKEKPARMTLASYNPELFVEGYPKRCNKSPTIIEDEDEIKERIKNGEDIMKYPLFDEFKVNYYSCEHRENHKHPGLMKTDLTQWPLPCCFEVNQLEKENSIRYMYENKVNIGGGDVYKEISLKILQTSHTLPLGGIGKPAKDITNYFKIIDQQNVYIRRYVPLGPRSAIVAIASALKIKRAETSDKEELDDFINEKIKEMKNIVRKNIGFQNAYEYDKKTLIQYLDQNEKFIDIRIFHNILEELFNCNIFIFVHNKEFTQGNFGCPEFSHNLLMFEKKFSLRHSVILYETTGSNIENLLYPHYEIIGQYNTEEGDTNFIFDKDSVTIKELVKLYKSMYFPFGNNTKNILNSIKFNTKILEQQVDFFGKTRLILFENDVNVITMPIDSISNQRLQNKKSTFKYSPCSLGKALDFMKNEKVKYKQVIVRNILVGLKGSKNNLDFYIPITPQEISITNENIQQLPSITFIRDSEMEKYNNYEQISRHLLSHVIYEFSKFIIGKKLEDNLFNLLEEFYNKVFEIRQSESIDLYKEIPRDFNKQTSFKRNSKIIISSQELAKRLLYSLLVECRKGFSRIREYKDLIYVPNYYKNIRDFGSSEDNIIFQNTESVEKWMNVVKQPLYQIHEKLNQDFMNDLEKGFSVINGETFFDGKLKGVFICKKENDNITETKGTLIVLNSDKIDVIGEGSNLHLTFLYNDETYLLRLTKYN